MCHPYPPLFHRIPNFIKSIPNSSGDCVSCSSIFSENREKDDMCVCRFGGCARRRCDFRSNAQIKLLPSKLYTDFQLFPLPFSSPPVLSDRQLECILLSTSVLLALLLFDQNIHHDIFWHPFSDFVWTSGWCSTPSSGFRCIFSPCATLQTMNGTNSSSQIHWKSVRLKLPLHCRPSDSEIDLPSRVGTCVAYLVYGLDAPYYRRP